MFPCAISRPRLVDTNSPAFALIASSPAPPSSRNANHCESPCHASRSADLYAANETDATRPRLLRPPLPCIRIDAPCQSLRLRPFCSLPPGSASVMDEMPRAAESPPPLYLTSRNSPMQPSYSGTLSRARLSGTSQIPYLSASDPAQQACHSDHGHVVDSRRDGQSMPLTRDGRRDRSYLPCAGRWRSNQSANRRMSQSIVSQPCFLPCRITSLIVPPASRTRATNHSDCSCGTSVSASPW